MITDFMITSLLDYWSLPNWYWLIISNHCSINSRIWQILNVRGLSVRAHYKTPNVRERYKIWIFLANSPNKMKELITFVFYYISRNWKMQISTIEGNRKQCLLCKNLLSLAQVLMTLRKSTWTQWLISWRLMRTQSLLWITLWWFHVQILTKRYVQSEAEGNNYILYIKFILNSPLHSWGFMY